MKVPILLIVILLTNSSLFGSGSDTVHLNLVQAERMFLQNNARLIAQRYEMEQAKAEVITAKLFDNPEFSYENLFYNQESKRFFETSRATGQYDVSITQLIRLGGKRNKNIRLAEAGVKLSEHAYAELMRTLRYELRSTYYKAYYNQLSVDVFSGQLSALQKLLEASEQQLRAGNIADKDVIRIKSRLYSLRTEYTSAQNTLEDLKSRLKLLVRLRGDKALVLKGDGIDPATFKPEATPYQLLLDSAKANRADLLMARTELTVSQNLLSVQKAMAVPDLGLSLSYDLKGNYPEKYTGIGISMPVPLFNRNQGEIKKAKIGVDVARSELAMQEELVENELYAGYLAAVRLTQLFNGLDLQFSQRFEALMIDVTRNFHSRNISLVEFLDFYDAYKEGVSEQNELKFELMNAKEVLNFHTGTSIFK